MSAEAKAREDRKRAHAGSPPGPDAKKQAHADAKPAASFAPPSTFLQKMQAVVNGVEVDYLREQSKDPRERMYNALVMFTRAVPERNGGNDACFSVNFVILDVEESKGRGVIPGYSTAPYEKEAVEKQREYFTTQNKLKPGVTRTVLHQVVKGRHGFHTILTPYTYEEHPKAAQKNVGKGLGSKKQVGAVYPGMEMVGRIFLDENRADPFMPGSDKKDINTFVIGRVGLLAQRVNRVREGYGLKLFNVQVCKSAPMALLFENASAYYNDRQDVQQQTESLLQRRNFEDNEGGELDNTAFENITNKHSPYSKPFIVVDSGSQADGAEACYAISVGADGASMELTLHSKKSILDRKAMQVQVHNNAFAHGGQGIDMHWVCSYYKFALDAGKALVVVSYDERALKGEGAFSLQCLVLVREELLFAPPPGHNSAFELPPQLVSQLACPETAAKQLRDPVCVAAQGDGDKKRKYCGWRLPALPGCTDAFYVIQMEKPMERNDKNALGNAPPPSCSAVCALREIRNLPQAVFHVLLLCRMDASSQLVEVVQCALLQPAVMPAMPKIITGGAASSTVGLLGDLGL